jgi:O-antigen/teichoic acid export membrane protein
MDKINYTKNSVNGLFLDIAGQLIIQILILFITPRYISLTSKELFGIWLLVNSVIGWISIADSGINVALSRSLILNNSNKEGINNSVLISTSFFAFILTGIIFLIIGILILYFGPRLFHLPINLEKPYKYLLIICLISSIISLPLSIYTSILESKFQQSFLRINNTISTLIGTLSGFLLIINNVGIISLGFGLLISVLLNGLVNIYKSNKISEYKLNIKYFNYKVLKDLFNFGAYFQIGKIGNVIALNADNIIITILFGPSVVVGYNFTFKLSQLFGNMIASKIPISILPAFTHNLALGETDKLKDIVRKLINILIRSSLLFGILIIVLNKYFVTWWVGSSNFSGWNLTYIFALWTIYETLYRGSNAIIYAHGDLKKWSFYSLLEGVINLLLSYFLGKYIGIVGVAVATILSRVSTSGFYTFIFFKKYDYIDVSVVRKGFFILLKTIPTFIILTLLFHYLPDENILIKISLLFIFGIIVNILSFDFKIIYRNRNKKANLILIDLINSQ